jgi:cytochrome c5
MNILSMASWVVVNALVLAGAQAASGEAIYRAKCSSCHDSGAGLAPRVTVPADWSEREKRGRAAMLESALKGMPATAMAARGGYSELSDDEVRATVDYMLARVGYRDPPAVAVATPAATAEAPAAASGPVDDATLVQRVAEALQKSLAPAARIELYAGEATLRNLNIRVGVRGGVVMLSGAVEKADVIPRAQAIARAVSGVREVQSRLIGAGMLDFD